MENPQSQPEIQSKIDSLLDQFDEAWNRNEGPWIQDYLLPNGDDHFDALLEELIKVDLEYRWRTPSDKRAIESKDSLPWFPLLRDYQTLFPELGSNDEISIALIAEEYRTRRRWGDQPQHSSYVLRFGRKVQVVAALTAIDKELQSHPAAKDLLGESPSLVRGMLDSVSPRLDSPGELSVGDRIGDFKLLNKLGSGAFAEVFLAQQESMQRLVALKVSTGTNQEPKLLSNLDHPNIVRVFDQRNVRQLSLLYMQYVAGGSLGEAMAHMRDHGTEPSGASLMEAIAAKLKENGQLPTYVQSHVPVQQLSWSKAVCWLGARLTEALGHAHEQGVLHRDIKPDNILLTAEASPMLVDFNLSFGKTIAGMSAHDCFGGSLAYMSPQQLRVFTGESTPQHVDNSSDFFSLCVVMWELLTGKRPYPDETLSDTDKQRFRQMVQLRLAGPNFDELPADCPGGLRKTLEECLTTTTLTELSSVDSIVRRLHLAMMPAADQLMNPEPDSWPARWAKYPTSWLLMCGLLPNIVLSIFNIWANKHLTIERFDLELFTQRQQPVINAINFSIGVGCGLWILVPVIKAMWAQQSGIFGRLPDWERIGHRCLLAPGLLAGLILALWVGSGISFPLWNQMSPQSDVGMLDFFAFLSSQVLHGLIAAATTYVLISLVTVQAHFPRFLPEHEDPIGEQCLASIDRQLGWANACLMLTPLLAMLVLGWSEHVDSEVFVALGLMGFIGYVMTSKLTPRIRRAIQTLRFALGPTNKLTSMGPLPAEYPVK